MARRRLAWAALLARVFALDVTLCPAWDGRMRLVAVLTNPDSIRSYLTGAGLAAAPPAVAGATGFSADVASVDEDKIRGFERLGFATAGGRQPCVAAGRCIDAVRIIGK